VGGRPKIFAQSKKSIRGAGARINKTDWRKPWALPNQSDNDEQQNGCLKKPIKGVFGGVEIRLGVFGILF
jgi:uncharacterized Fe-S cluster protein YjdI